MTTQPNHRLVTTHYRNVAPPHITLERYNGAAWEPQFSTQDQSWLNSYLTKAHIKIDKPQNITVKED